VTYPTCGAVVAIEGQAGGGFGDSEKEAVANAMGKRGVTDRD
jgi:hypothetical protein